jgi:hypothetical protein
LNEEEIEMDKRTMVLLGSGLIGLGLLWLLLGLVAGVLGINLFGFALRFWPASISALGLAFVLPPFLVRGKKGLGGLFIPGMLLLVIGGLLLIASVLNAWGLWTWFWPMVLLGLASGFVAAGLYMDVNGLLIPATIVGLNGLVFQFCAVTGLWSWWSVLWTVEPLSVGLALLLFGARQGSRGTLRAGLILCSIAAGAFVLMMAILAGGWLFRLMAPGLLILAGVVTLGWAIARGFLPPRAAAE